MKILILLSASVLFFSCRKEQQPVPSPYPQQPAAKLVKKISTDPLEFQFFEYNANHELTGYTIQFVNNLADRTVSKLTKEIVYENNFLTKQVSAAGIEQYYYTAGKLDSIRTTAVNGKWISTLFPAFNQQNQLISVLELIRQSGPDAPDALKYEYSYDSKGNLTLQKASARYANSPQFVLLEQTVFSDYDQSINTESRAYGGIFIKGITMMKNNPGKQVTYNANNVVTNEISFIYTYFNDGYIATRTKKLKGSNTDIVFFYEYY